MRQMPPLGEILRELSYDPATGEFTWCVTRHRITSGSIAGHINAGGYRVIRFKGKPYYAHRLAWYISKGEVPSEIDHINQDKSDNRLSNLRVVSRSENNFNRVCKNKYGVSGIYKTGRGRFAAQIGQRHIGTFKTPDEAVTARLSEMEKQMEIKKYE